MNVMRALWVIVSTYIIIAAFWMVFALMPTAAAAASCAPLDTAQARLSGNYGEQLVWIGLERSGDQLVIFANPDGGTFTIGHVDPDSLFCILAAGDGWAAFSADPPTPGIER